MNIKQRKLQESADNYPEISIIVPAYNESGNLERLYAGLGENLTPLGLAWEIIIVDDGSEESTWHEITALHGRDFRVQGLRLSRNFGHQYALLAGYSQALGEAVISIDADLQHPPEVIPLLVNEWRKGMKIVHTLRRDPENLSYLKRMSSRFFYKIFSFLSGVTIGQGMADFRLLDRLVVNEIIRLKETGLFLRGLVRRDIYHPRGWKSALHHM